MLAKLLGLPMKACADMYRRCAEFCRNMAMAMA
jgi:hypothetical protein